MDTKEALEGMVWEFGYRVVLKDKPVIWSCGSSALEDAFKALGWNDPKYLPEEGWHICEIEGCVEANMFRNEDRGTRWEGLYLGLCSGHLRDCNADKERPLVKQYALDREARRGPDGILKEDE